MHLDAITPKLLADTLRAAQQKRPLPPGWDAPHFLRPVEADSPAGRDLALREHLAALAAAQLEAARRFEGILTPAAPPSKPAMSSALCADFGPRSDDLEAWSALYHRYLAPSSLSVEEMAHAANVEERSFRRRVDDGLRLLADLLREQERQAHLAANVYLRRHLPPPDYVRLFGVQDSVTRLHGLLTAPDGPRLVSIEGMGGIGKTALAQETAVRLAESGWWEGILWISARQQRIDRDGTLLALDDAARSLDDVVTRLAHQLGQSHLAGQPTVDKLAALGPVLSAAPYLIVIDNLETLSDSRELVPALYPLAGGARFLLTSRRSLRDWAFVQTCPVPPLSLENSSRLVQGELERRGHRVPLDADSLRSLYNVVGGVPLALKLIAAQIPHFPLDHLLDWLRRAGGRMSEGMFTYIYRHAWQLLDDPARRLLLAMLTLSPDGEDVAWMRLISDLPEAQFEPALAALLDCGLLQVSGSLQEPLYHLHRLTVTFLQSDLLLGWQTKGIADE